MKKNFSPFLEKKYDSLKKLVGRLSNKFEYVSLLASDCQGKYISVSDKRTNVKDSNWNERGFVVRVFNNGIYSEFSFDMFSSVKEIYSKIVNSVDLSEPFYKSIYVKAYKNDTYDEEELVESFSRMDEFEDVSIEDVISTFKKSVSNIMEENEYIITANFNAEYLVISKMFISTKKDLKQCYAWANADFSCVVNKDDVTKSNYGGASGVSLKTTINKLLKKVKSISKDSTVLLDAGKVVPGEYECITTPEISGLIAHEAFGHGVEMDMFIKGRAMAQKYIGEQVGSELVEMHDGAKPHKDVSAYFFDDEGTLAQNTIEIKNGILKTGVADAITARKLNIKPTGNGKRESYKSKAYTRMTATYFSPKKSTLEEMIKSIKFGYLIDVSLSGMEDPKHWGIQCMALIGKEIKDGELTGKMVSPIIMTGYVPELLNSISMVSKDFELYGTKECGKGYKEWVKTSIGGPYLKVKVKLG